MNGIEIEQAVTELVEAPFDPQAFPFAFLEAFGNKFTTIKRLKSTSNSSNQSDLGGVLQRNNIHLKVCLEGEVPGTLTALRDSPATTKHKAKIILATDGVSLEAENLLDGETLACDYPQLADHFAFFFSLAGISTVKQIRENAFDIKATGRLNRLYVALLQENPDWDGAERREAFNHFMARLIFCFFAEDTGIFPEDGLFTRTVEQMSERDASNTHEVLAELFRAMRTPHDNREEAQITRWASKFPYVNGGLFAGEDAAPRFSRIAQRYLMHVGHLDWTKINPDIFGSMIQAVADEDERGELGMHYTSVPNILKVLNPLFLDSLHEQLDSAGDNGRKLLNLRQRLERIRVFDPACGSGNFLVIAYKQMRKIENEINHRRGEGGISSVIPITNFRGIELRHFSAEIARLALIIAEYQCDVKYRGKQLAIDQLLPLKSENWITCGNALKLDWLSICPPTGAGVKLVANDLFSTPLDQAEIDFENEGGETYICGNPPYIGDKKQNKHQKYDIEKIFSHLTNRWKSLDYISGFFYKAAQYIRVTEASSSFVSTNSICQGQQVNVLWPLVLKNIEISHAHTSFKWSNLAANNAGVVCVIVGLFRKGRVNKKYLFENGLERVVSHISPYLTSSNISFVGNAKKSLFDLPNMTNGSAAKDDGNLIINGLEEIPKEEIIARAYVRPLMGSDEFIKGKIRFCFWIQDQDVEKARTSAFLSSRFEKVSKSRSRSTKKATQAWADKPHRFVEIRNPPFKIGLIVPSVSSDNREYLPAGIVPQQTIITNLAFAIFDPPLWALSLITSKLHKVWIANVCGRLGTGYRYSNTLGWNTFPVPTLTQQNKADLTRCAEDILLTREAHFPATIADLYDPENMPADLRAAHERNDETLERVYIGRQFKNDTERLEKLFALYTKMITQPSKSSAPTDASSNQATIP